MQLVLFMLVTNYDRNKNKRPPRANAINFDHNSQYFTAFQRHNLPKNRFIVTGFDATRNTFLVLTLTLRARNVLRRENILFRTSRPK